MALGTTQLSEIKEHTSNIVNLCGESGVDGSLFDQCNTFNYVVQHLDEWASDVPRITALKEKMTVLADGISELAENTITLTKYVDELVKNMDDINNRNVN